MASSSPRIVVLDGFTLNPGDMSWNELESLGECTVYDHTLPDELLQRARDAELILTNKVVLSAESIAKLEKLQYIGILATGINVVDVSAAAARGIIVSNVPSYSTPSVAQMVFAHILNHTQHVAQHAEAVSSGRWSSAIDFCFWNFPLVELAGKTIGIVGLGQIGRAVARLAVAFEMRVLATTRSATIAGGNIKIVELDTLLQESDIVTLHCPLTPDTKHLVDRQRLNLMKKSALLINTSRGLLVDETALADALNSEQIAGAGVDVLSEEPPRESPLFAAKNCYITPHIAWATLASRQRLLNAVVENAKSFLAGKPQNVV